MTTRGSSLHSHSRRPLTCPTRRPYLLFTAKRSGVDPLLERVFDFGACRDQRLHYVHVPSAAAPIKPSDPQGSFALAFFFEPVPRNPIRKRIAEHIIDARASPASSWNSTARTVRKVPGPATRPGCTRPRRAASTIRAAATDESTPPPSSDHPHRETPAWQWRLPSAARRRHYLQRASPSDSTLVVPQRPLSDLWRGRVGAPRAQHVPERLRDSPLCSRSGEHSSPFGVPTISRFIAFASSKVSARCRPCRLRAGRVGGGVFHSGQHTVDERSRSSRSHALLTSSPSTASCIAVAMP